MHDNRRQFIFYFGQGANVLDIFALNAQPIRENKIGDWDSLSRIFAQVARVNRLKLAFVCYVRNRALRREQRIFRKVAAHRIRK